MVIKNARSYFVVVFSFCLAFFSFSSLAQLNDPYTRIQTATGPKFFANKVRTAPALTIDDFLKELRPHQNPPPSTLSVRKPVVIEGTAKRVPANVVINTPKNVAQSALKRCLKRGPVCLGPQFLVGEGIVLGLGIYGYLQSQGLDLSPDGSLLVLGDGLDGYVTNPATSQKADYVICRPPSSVPPNNINYPCAGGYMSSFTSDVNFSDAVQSLYPTLTIKPGWHYDDGRPLTVNLGGTLVEWSWFSSILAGTGLNREVKPANYSYYPFDLLDSEGNRTRGFIVPTDSNGNFINLGDDYSSSFRVGLPEPLALEEIDNLDFTSYDPQPSDLAIIAPDLFDSDLNPDFEEIEVYIEPIPSYDIDVTEKSLYEGGVLVGTEETKRIQEFPLFNNPSPNPGIGSNIKTEVVIKDPNGEVIGGSESNTTQPPPPPDEPPLPPSTGTGEGGFFSCANFRFICDWFDWTQAEFDFGQYDTLIEVIDVDVNDYLEEYSFTSNVEGCPSPNQLDLGIYGSIEVPYAFFCDLADKVRPLFLALISFISAMIYFKTFRKIGS